MKIRSAKPNVAQQITSCFIVSMDSPHLLQACLMTNFFLLHGLAVLGLLLASAEATVYTVGDSAGWDISADLPTWVAGKIFHVGDALLFQYSQYHTLNVVDRDGFNSCNATNALLTAANGNTTVPLTTAGEKYFICGIFSHCLGGLKLQINVEGHGAPAPAGAAVEAPQTAGFYPQGPSSKNENPIFGTASFGVVHDARDSMVVAWMCTIGALVGIVVVGI